MKDTFRFDDPGTIARPGPVGRIVRLTFGAACLWVVSELVAGSDTTDLYIPSFWVLAAFGLLLAPYVVNIGFGLNLGAWPRVVSVGLILVSAAIGIAISGSVLSSPLWATVTGWMVYIYGHLGISFLLSAILATPGCEMRAIPHLLGKIRRKDVREHYCPGFIENVDRWEHGRRIPQDEKSEDHASSNTPASRDILGDAGSQLLVYGVPFAAVQLAGNLGGFAIATAVPAVSFLLVGILCSLNAARARRVHCYFMGPWCLFAGVMIALYGLRVIDFGPGSWSLLVNTALMGTLVIYLTTERIWGKYLGSR